MPCKTNKTQASDSFISTLKMKADLIPNPLSCYAHHDKLLLQQEHGWWETRSPGQRQAHFTGLEYQGIDSAKFLGAGEVGLRKKNHHHLVGYFKLIYHSRVSHKKHISKLFPAEAPSGLLTCVCSCITATKNKAELNFMDNVFIREAD